MCTLTQLQLLPIQERTQYIRAHGICIDESIQGTALTKLYWFGHYFAEVVYSMENQISEIRLRETWAVMDY